MRVRLWAMRTGPLSPEEADRLLEALPMTLQEKIRMTVRAARQQSILAYSLLQLALREDYQIKLPDIAWTAQGKPYFPERRDLFFNLSHTDGAVLVGLSEREIGVDMEKDREAPVRLRKLLQAEDSFFSQWVRWEACAKCLGVSVLSLLRTGILPEYIRYYEIETFPGYWSGVAVQGETANAVVRLAVQEQLLPIG